MPSPIAHSALVLIVRAVAARHMRLRRVLSGRPTFFYGAAVAALLVPDVDFLLRAPTGHAALSHGGATHSLAVGILFGLLFAAACRVWYGDEFPIATGASIGLACAWAHGVMDMATWGSGVMLLWPLSLERYSTVTLFFGAHHSQPFAWKLHLITLSTELLFVAALWWITRGFWRTGPSPDDPRADATGAAVYGK